MEFVVKKGSYGDRGNCSVIAIQTLLNVDYDTAKDLSVQHFDYQVTGGALMGKATIEGFFKHHKLAYKWIFPRDLGYQGSATYQRKMKDRRVRPMNMQPTLSWFCKQYPKGNFWMFTKAHVFCYKDGVVTGTGSESGRMKLKNVYQILDA